MEVRRESDMLEPARRWLRSEGLMVKAEMVQPWGVCDLVGCSLDRRSVEKRLALRQRVAMGPPLRIVLMLEIPERGSTTLQALQQEYAAILSADEIADEVHRLIAGRFVRRTQRGRLLRMNGWMPLQDRLVAVELKLSRVREALRQAAANRGITWESYAAFPDAVAQRIIHSRRRREFHEAGVGVLSVIPRGCEVLLAARRDTQSVDQVAQTHCVERFWRTYLRGN